MKMRCAFLVGTALIVGCGVATSEGVESVPSSLGGGGVGGAASSTTYRMPHSYFMVLEIEPTFAGMYIDDDQKLVIVLTDVARFEDAMNAIQKVYPPGTFDFYLPARAVKGTYNYLQLDDWKLAV